MVFHREAISRIRSAASSRLLANNVCLASLANISLILITRILHARLVQLVLLVMDLLFMAWLQVPFGRQMHRLDSID